MHGHLTFPHQQPPSSKVFCSRWDEKVLIDRNKVCVFLKDRIHAVDDISLVTSVLVLTQTLPLRDTHNGVFTFYSGSRKALIWTGLVVVF